MKKFTLEQIESLIKNEVYTPEELKYKLHYRYFLIGQDYFTDKKIEMPIDWLASYVIESEKKEGYMVPMQYSLILPLVKNTPEEEILWRGWTEQTKETYLTDKAGEELKNAEKQLKQTGRNLFAHYYTDKVKANLTDPVFWKCLFEGWHRFSKVGFDYYLNYLADFFENEDDIVSFQKVLGSKYHNEGKVNLQYYLLLKLLKLHAKDYSIKEMPPLLMNHLKERTAEPILVELMTAFRKYDFSLIKEEVLSLYSKCPKKKVVELARQILKDNGYFENEKTSTLINKESCHISYHATINIKSAIEQEIKLAEENLLKETQALFDNHLVCQDNQTLTYHVLVEINEAYLKEKSQDSIFVIRTITLMVKNALTKQYENAEFHFSHEEDKIVYSLHTSKKEQLLDFRETLEKYLEFAFSAQYLNVERYKLFSTGKRGERISHEKDKAITGEFEKMAKTTIFAEKLQKSLPEKEKGKTGRSKI